MQSSKQLQQYLWRNTHWIWCKKCRQALALSTRGAVLFWLVALLGFTWWNARRTSSSLLLNIWSHPLSRRSFRNIMNLPMFRRKIVRVKTIEELRYFIDSARIFDWGYFFVCCRLHIYSATSYNSTLFSSYYNYMKWLSTFFLYRSFCFRFPLSVPFAHTYILLYLSFGTQVSSCLWCL